jgi:hypothetical protein
MHVCMYVCMYIRIYRYEKVIYPERHFPYTYESLGTDVNAAAARRIQTGTNSEKSEIYCYIPAHILKSLKYTAIY